MSPHLGPSQRQRPARLPPPRCDPARVPRPPYPCSCPRPCPCPPGAAPSTCALRPRRWRAPACPGDRPWGSGGCGPAPASRRAAGGARPPPPAEAGSPTRPTSWSWSSSWGWSRRGGVPARAVSAAPPRWARARASFRAWQCLSRPRGPSHGRRRVRPASPFPSHLLNVTHRSVERKGKMASRADNHHQSSAPFRSHEPTPFLILVQSTPLPIHIGSDQLTPNWRSTYRK